MFGRLNLVVAVVSFTTVVTMLKIWGIPFDILRLDEQRLQINRFPDGEAKPDYGSVIWMADPEILKGTSANYTTMKGTCEECKISMITLFDKTRNRQVQEIKGLFYHKNKVQALKSKNGLFY